MQLYSILREKLPHEAKGRTILEMEDGASLGDLLMEFDITRRVVISLNGAHVSELSHSLKDGDEVKIFSSVSGG